MRKLRKVLGRCLIQLGLLIDPTYHVEVKNTTGTTITLTQKGEVFAAGSKIIVLD